MSEKQPTDEKPTGEEKPPVNNVADDPEPRPEKKPISEIKPEPRPEARPEVKPEPKPELKEPILEPVKEETTPHHKVAVKKPHKCPHCGKETEPCTIKTNQGVINARVCQPCGKAYT